MSAADTSEASYVLGSHAVERERLERQHAIWREAMLRSWDQAGFGPGQRLLDLGCGPGYASRELAERVGPAGQVLAIDSAPLYLEHLEQQLQQRAMPQLRTLRHDLASASGSPPPGLEGGALGWGLVPLGGDVSAPARAPAGSGDPRAAPRRPAGAA